jgi:hypothetical protein
MAGHVSASWARLIIPRVAQLYGVAITAIVDVLPRRGRRPATQTLVWGIAVYTDVRAARKANVWGITTLGCVPDRR